MRTGTRWAALGALVLSATLLAADNTRAHEEPPPKPYWTLDFHIYQAGLQDLPEPNANQMKTESVGHGTIKFTTKPRKNVYEIGKVTAFYLDQYDFAHANPEAPNYKRFGLRDEGRRVQVKLGTHNRKIVKLPLIVAEALGATNCNVGQKGTLTAIQGQFSDAFRTSFPTDSCDFYTRQFETTATVVVDDLVKHDG
jgi:hypothetical protein